LWSPVDSSHPHKLLRHDASRLDALELAQASHLQAAVHFRVREELGPGLADSCSQGRGVGLVHHGEGGLELSSLELHASRGDRHEIVCARESHVAAGRERLDGVGLQERFVEDHAIARRELVLLPLDLGSEVDQGLVVGLRDALHGQKRRGGGEPTLVEPDLHMVRVDGHIHGREALDGPNHVGVRLKHLAAAYNCARRQLVLLPGHGTLYASNGTREHIDTGLGGRGDLSNLDGVHVGLCGLRGNHRRQRVVLRLCDVGGNRDLPGVAR
jgi:hypothetical protein